MGRGLDRERVRTEQCGFGELDGFAEAPHRKVYETSVLLLVRVKELHEEGYHVEKRVISAFCPDKLSFEAYVSLAVRCANGIL